MLISAIRLVTLECMQKYEVPVHHTVRLHPVIMQFDPYEFLDNANDQ